jgi:putative serine protease PepD
MRRRGPAAAIGTALAGLSLFLAACDGGGSGSQSAASGPSTAQAAQSGGAVGLQAKLVSVIHAMEPRVVQVENSRGLGSGVVFDNRGDIVTNAHVAGSAHTFRITSSDGKRYAGTLVGIYRPDDLAVVRAKGAHLEPATFGSSSDLQVGDLVLAIGNPLGLRSSVTNGIVSALGRTVPEPNGPVLPNVIQTSAAINPGNSGGALVNLAGDVVGIPTLAAVDPELGGSAAPGIGFAIPGEVARDIAGQIVKYGHVVHSHRAYLGVELAATSQAPGAVVAGVEKGGPADKAGIRPGDVITGIDGHSVASPTDVSSVLAKLEPGRTVHVKLAGGKTSSVKLGQYPSGGG